MKKLLLIINPNSGKGISDKIINKAIQNFEKTGYKINKVYTEKDESTYETIKEQASNTDLIVCCGGDGTLNEIVNAIMKLNIKVKLEFIPLGTMNDYAKTLKISKKLLSSSDKKVIPVDIGKFNEKYFNYVAAFGAFTQVSYKTPQFLKKIFGKFAYFIIAIKYLFKIKSYEINLTLENETIEGKYIYCSISNSESVAGFKWFKNEKFSLADGKFELLLIRKPNNPIQFFKTLILLIAKKYKEPYFIYKQISDIKIQTKEEIRWTLDGEKSEKTKEVELKNIPKRIEYVVPYKFNKINKVKKVE